MLETKTKRLPDGRFCTEISLTEKAKYKGISRIRIPRLSKFGSSIMDDPTAKIDIDEYLISSGECFRQFDPDEKLDPLPQNYYVGSVDPVETGDPHTENQIPFDALWHDTANGILKKFSPIRQLFGSPMIVGVWVAVAGPKYVTDDEGNIVGEIVPKVNVSLNKRKMNDEEGKQIAPFSEKVRKPPLKLDDLLSRLENKEEIIDDEDAD